VGKVGELSPADRSFVVTGAASAIGAETTAELMRRDAHVIGVDRNRVDEADDWRSVDLLERSSIADLVESLPFGLNGLAHKPSGLCSCSPQPYSSPMSSCSRTAILR